MTTQAWLMTGLLVMMFALLVWDRFPTWLVFIGTLTVAMTLRLTTIDKLLRGFSNPGVITVAALFHRGWHVLHRCHYYRIRLVSWPTG